MILEIQREIDNYYKAKKKVNNIKEKLRPICDLTTHSITF
jgi:hypothetical protein